MAEDSEDDFQRKCKLLEKDNEDFRKRLAQSEKQLSSLQASVNEYQEIIMRNLKNESTAHNEELDKCNKQLIELETNIEEKRKSYQTEICENDNEIQRLLSQLEEAKNKASKAVTPKVDQKLEDTLVSLHEQTEEFNEKVALMQKNLSSKIEENAAALKKITELETELCQYKELTDCENLKLEELNVVLTQVDEDYLALKTAHNSVENKTLDAENQGNSLFAEVNIRRVQLNENIETIKSQYLEMRQKKASYIKELTELQRINYKLKNQLKETEEEKILQQDRIISFLTQEVEILNILIESYKKELKVIQSEEIVELSGVDLADFLEIHQNKDLADLNEKLHRKVSDNVLLTVDATDQEKELRRRDLKVTELKLHVTELEQELNGLKAKLESISSLSNDVNDAENIPPVAIIKPKSILKTDNIRKKDQSIKVQFQNDQSFVNTSEKSRRRGRIVPSTKVVYYT